MNISLTVRCRILILQHCTCHEHLHALTGLHLIHFEPPAVSGPDGGGSGGGGLEDAGPETVHRMRVVGRDTKPETVPDTCQRRSQVV